MKLAVDLDGTLMKREGIPTLPLGLDNVPTEGAVEAMWHLRSLGIDIYVFTVRADDPRVGEWLKKWGFPDLRITNIKEKDTTAFIDDRAVRFTNWNDIRKLYG